MQLLNLGCHFCLVRLYIFRQSLQDDLNAVARSWAYISTIDSGAIIDRCPHMLRHPGILSTHATGVLAKPAQRTVIDKASSCHTQYYDYEDAANNNPGITNVRRNRESLFVTVICCLQQWFAVVNSDLLFASHKMLAFDTNSDLLLPTAISCFEWFFL